MYDPEARSLLQHLVRATIAELLAKDENTWDDPIPLLEMVYSQLDLSWRLGETELYLQLLRRYMTILEASGPFERFDKYLLQSLERLTLEASDLIRFADIRARWLIQRGEFRNAKLLLTRLWEVATTPELQAQVANREGVYWKEQSEFNQSRTLFQRAAEHAEAVEEYALLAKIYNNMGNWAFAQDLYVEALTYYQKAWEVAIPVASARILGGIAGGLAMTLEALKRYQEAYDYLENAEAYYRLAGFRPGVVRVLLNRSFIDAQLNRIERAKQACGEALSLARELGDPQRESTAFHNLGFTYAKEQDWANALLFYERALQLRHRLKHTLLVQTTLAEITNLSDTIRNDPLLFEANRITLLEQSAALIAEDKVD